MKQLFSILLFVCSFGLMAQTSVPLYGLPETSGTNTYLVTVTPTPALVDGYKVMIQFASANTGAATLKIGTLSTINLRRSDGSALEAGDILAGAPTWVVYDATATQFRLVGGGDALTTNPLSQFAATTSAQLAGVLSDETGTGNAVFSASPTLTGTPISPTASVGTSSTQVATTAFVGNQTEIVYNVKAYGAVGDGVTDETTAVTNALAAIPTKGGVLYFPAGDYLITSQIIVNKNVIIRGVGVSPFNFYNATTGVTGTPGATNILCSSTTLELFLFTNTGSNVFPIVNVENLSVFNTNSSTVTAGSAFRIQGALQRTTFRNVHVSGFYNNVNNTSASYSVFDNCVFVDPKNVALILDNTSHPDVGNQMVTNCRFISSRENNRNPVAGIYMKGGGGNIISNCVFNSGLNYTLPPTTTTVTQNFQYGIYTDLSTGATSELVITSCIFANYKESGIVVNNVSSSFNNLIVNGCMFTPASALASLREAVVLYDVSGATIDNVTATNYGLGAIAYGLIKITNSDNVTIGRSVVFEEFSTLYTDGGGNTSLVVPAIYSALELSNTQNTATKMKVINASTGTSAISGHYAQLDAVGSSNYAGMAILGTNFTTSGLLTARATLYEGNSTANMIISNFTNNDIIFATNSRVERMRIGANAITVADAHNFVFNTTTGTKLGTSTSQKLAFYNSTPIVQPGATTDLATVLSNLGLRASGAAFPLTTSGNVTAGKFYLSALNTAPANASDTGTAGEIRIDANHIYICTATNTWKRVAIATW